MPTADPPAGPEHRWALRPASRDDLEVIVAIEREAFARPWTAAIYAEEIQRESSWLTLAVDVGGEVVGFVCAWRILDACHLLRIATRQARRNAGIARALVRELTLAATAAGCVHIELEVASRNHSALALYGRLGFETVGRRPGYYRDPVDDALLMNLNLSPSPSPQP